MFKYSEVTNTDDITACFKIVFKYSEVTNTDDITACFKQIRIFVTISHDGGNAQIVITMNRTYYWLFVT